MKSLLTLTTVAALSLLVSCVQDEVDLQGFSFACGEAGGECPAGQHCADSRCVPDFPNGPGSVDGGDPGGGQGGGGGEGAGGEGQGGEGEAPDPDDRDPDDGGADDAAHDCVEDDDCPPGATCADGVCEGPPAEGEQEDDECQDDGDCGDEHSCLDGECIESGQDCELHGDCPEPMVCTLNEECEAPFDGCLDVANCAQGCGPDGDGGSDDSCVPSCLARTPEDGLPAVAALFGCSMQCEARGEGEGIDCVQGACGGHLTACQSNQGGDALDCAGGLACDILCGLRRDPEGCSQRCKEIPILHGQAEVLGRLLQCGVDECDPEELMSCLQQECLPALQECVAGPPPDGDPGGGDVFEESFDGDLQRPWTPVSGGWTIENDMYEVDQECGDCIDQFTMVRSGEVFGSNEGWLRLSYLFRPPADAEDTRLFAALHADCAIGGQGCHYENEPVDRLRRLYGGHHSTGGMDIYVGDEGERMRPSNVPEGAIGESGLYRMELTCRGWEHQAEYLLTRMDGRIGETLVTSGFIEGGEQTCVPPEDRRGVYVLLGAADVGTAFDEIRVEHLACRGAAQRNVRLVDRHDRCAVASQWGFNNDLNNGVRDWGPEGGDGGVGFVPDRWGEDRSAARLRGSGLEYARAPGMDSGRWTIEAWVTLDQVEGVRYVFDDRRDVGDEVPAGRMLGYTDIVQDRLICSVSDGSEERTASLDVNMEGEGWAYVACTYDGDAVELIFGGEQARTPVGDGFVYRPALGTHVHVGEGWDREGGWSGALDDVRVHEVVKSQGYIEQRAADI